MSNSMSAAHPARAPDWRWSIVCGAVKRSGIAFCPVGDRLVQTGARFWKAWTMCRSDAERQLVAEKLPTIAGAYQIFAGGSPSTRIGIEARVLANDAPGRIAQQAGLSGAVVRAYEALFYDVRDRLPCRDFILRSVIGLDEVAAECQPAQVCKAMAYFGGPRVLDELLFATGKALGHAESATDVAAVLSEIARAQLRRSVASALTAASPGDRRGLECLARVLAQMESRDSAGRANEPLTDYAANILAMLESMPLLVGRSSQGASSPLADIDASAVEPGAADLIRMASGETADGTWRDAIEAPYPPAAE